MNNEIEKTLVPMRRNNSTELLDYLFHKLIIKVAQSAEKTDIVSDDFLVMFHDFLMWSSSMVMAMAFLAVVSYAYFAHPSAEAFRLAFNEYRVFSSWSLLNSFLV